jgi:hypothetical protein
MTTITAPQHPHRFSIWEFCLLSYILKQSRPDGTFQQSAALISQTIDAEVRPIQRHIRDLVAKKHLVEVAPRYRDTLTNWWVPATYQVAPATLEALGRQRHLEPSPADAPSDIFETATGLHDTKSGVSPLNPQRHLEHPPAQAPATKVALEALPIKSVDSVSVLGSLDSSVSVVGSNAKSATPLTTPKVRDTRSPQFKKCKSPECWNEAPVDNDHCGVHDGTPPVNLVTVLKSKLQNTGPYSLGGKYPAKEFDCSRAPFCPFCGGHGTVDWSTYKGIVHLEEHCGEPACKAARLEMLKNNEALSSEGWTKTAARRRSEFERHDELQEKREENAKNPTLYDDNGRYRRGQSYPCELDEDGISQYDTDLLPDCEYCIVEQCAVFTSESGDRFTVSFTCENSECNAKRAKVLQSQKEFDERVSEDETLITREETVV